MPSPRSIALATAVGIAVAAPLPVSAQQFGGSLALHHDQVLIGETGNQTLAGIVYLFSEVDGEWTETGQLRVTEELRSPDGFGRSLGLSDGILLVGAPLGSEGAGVAYLFESDGTGEWSPTARLEASDAGAGARFGNSVLLTGNTAVVAAPGADSGIGAVYVFARSAAGGWSQEAKIPAPNPSAGTGFGQQLALDGSQMLVTSAGQSRGQVVVYAYRRDGTAGWESLGRIEVDGLDDRSGFGSAIGFKDGSAFIGAPGQAQRVGRVFQMAFDDRASAWTTVGELAPLVPESNTRFGSWIDFDGERTIVGAPGARGGLGAVYALTPDSDGNWSQATIVSSPSLPQGAAFGQAARFAGRLAVIGATGVEERSGAAVVFQQDGADWVERATLKNEVRGFPAIAGEEVHCLEGQATLFECKDVNITAFLPINALGGSRGTRVNDVWGWTDPDSGTEYVIVGRTNGTSFVDISDPYNPVYVGDLPKTEGSRTTIWRDMKVYSNHVYIVADAAGEHGVQVFDLTRLRDYAGEPLTFDETFRYEGIHSAHNIVINEETGFAYAVGNSGGGETCGGGLHMIDLDTPSRPQFAGCFAEIGTGRRGTGYAHDAQCVVYRGPDAEHEGKEVCFGSNETALNIADVSDKSNPVSIATASYPSVAYAHQGWLTEDHTFFYMNDEGDEPQGLVEGTRTLVWDVTDLDDPILVKEHIAETTATDHNLYVHGDRMYQSNYSAGFRVFDVSDPADPVEIGFIDTSPYEGGASWSNYPFFESGIIAVTGTGDGLFLVRDMARRNLIP